MDPGRLLVRLPNWVGDILMARPAIQALRARWPDAQLVGMVRPRHAALAERLGVFDRIVVSPGGSGLARVAAVRAAAGTLRSLRVDTAVVLAPSFEAALSPWLAGVGRRIGHGTDHRRLLLTDPVAPRAGAHRADEYIDLARVLDAGVPPPETRLSLIAADRACAASLFAAMGWRADSRPLFVNPAAAKTPRAWSAERFRVLVERLPPPAGLSSCMTARPSGRFRAGPRRTAWPWFATRRCRSWRRCSSAARSTSATTAVRRTSQRPPGFQPSPSTDRPLRLAPRRVPPRGDRTSRSRPDSLARRAASGSSTSVPPPRPRTDGRPVSTPSRWKRLRPRCGGSWSEASLVQLRLECVELLAKVRDLGRHPGQAVQVALLLLDVLERPCRSAPEGLAGRDALA